MRRRDFIAGLAGAAATWPRAAHAQQRATPVVGFLGSSTAGTVRHALMALRSGLEGAGYVEGQSVVIEYRFVEGQFDRIPAMLSDLIRNGATVLVTASSGAIAAKRANTTIPVVFVTPSDPMELGLVDSINRPGGNFTGVHMFAAGLEGKRLGLLHEVVPKARTIAVLINSNFSAASAQSRDVQEAAVRLGVQPVIAHANTEGEFDAAFTTFVQRKADALLVCASPFFNSRRRQLVVLAARHSLPAIYEWRDFAEEGGLMSYGSSLNDAYYQMGVYVGRILRGEKPSDLPVVQTTKFEFAINLSTAKALGIEVSGTLSARADEIIE